MSDFYTRVGEGKYEVHFTTDEQWKYALVEAACREAIDHAKPLMVTENAPRWHRVDEPPKEGQNVLTMDANEDMETATYDGEGFEDSYGFYVTDVLYWMPIEPPKEDA